MCSEHPQRRRCRRQGPSCGLSGTLLGHLVPSICTGTASQPTVCRGCRSVKAWAQRQTLSVEITSPTAGNRKQEHAAETIQCAWRKRLCHAWLKSIRVKKLPLNLVRAGFSLLQVSSGPSGDKTISIVGYSLPCTGQGRVAKGIS